MMHRHTLSLTALCLSALGLSACSSMGSHSMYSQAELPATVQVPAGHKVAMETVGVGQITYECRAKKDMAAEHEWVFVGPDAKLQTRSGTVIGKYWGPPATWENNDGSKVTATQLAVAPAGAGNIRPRDHGGPAVCRGMPVRDVLRQKGTPYDELGLGDPQWTDEQLVDFMLQHPVLINRPIVVTPLGTRLCRPSEAVLDILPQPQQATFSKEDGEAVIDSKGNRIGKL